MRSREAWLVVVASLVAACGGESSEGPPDAPQGVDAAQDAAVIDADLEEPDAPGAQPTVQPAACRFSVPDSDGFDEGVAYACGDLTTVLDRDAGTGVVTLHFMRVFSTAQTGRMTIWLDGGPGGSGQRMVNRIANSAELRDAVLVDGDFVIFGQRGTRLAQPTLVDEFVSVDLAPYNTGASADDVNDLRTALGFTSMNVWGISYGSRLGLEVLRRHGQHVRAASLGGLVPPTVTWIAEVPRSMESAIDALQASCAADAGCAAAYGDLKAKFIAGVFDLADSPLLFDNLGFELDGGTYASALFSSLYARSTYPWLPLLISDIAARRTDRIADYLELLFQDPGEGVSQGLYYAIVCGEQFNPPAPDEPAQSEAGVDPNFLAIYGGGFESFVDGCRELDIGEPRPELSVAVASAVPTLIDSGALDPITPPSFAEIAAETLSNDTVVVVPNSGHGALVQSACGRQILRAFLAAPTAPVDLSCAAGVTTEYVLPSALVGRQLERRQILDDLATSMAPRPRRPARP